MKTQEIHEAFCTLREMCDPRGHGLLDALENLCIIESLSIDSVLDIVGKIELEQPNVIPLLRDYSVKV